MPEPTRSVELPCNQPCPKCGSGDICRRFYSRGEGYEGSTEYDKAPPGFTGQCHSFSAVNDLIFNHCRICQYEWGSKPIPKRQAKLKKEGE